MNKPRGYLVWLAFVALAVLAGGCAAPIGVERADPRAVHRELTGSVLSTGELSGFSRIVLNRWDLAERFGKDPAAALAELHEVVAAGPGGADEVFALAELAFLHADNSHDPAYYRAAAVYAYAFLFPQGADTPPDSFDPRLRTAADLYNQAISAGFAAADSAEVDLRAGRYRLPFGQLDVAFDPNRLNWADRRLVHFVPVDEIKIVGLRNRYRQPGLGAPLTAGTEPLHPEQEEKLFIAPRVQVPVTALLRTDDARRRLATGRLSATLELYPATGEQRVRIGAQTIPLEAEPPPPWLMGSAARRCGSWNTEVFCSVTCSSKKKSPNSPRSSPTDPVVFL